MSYVQKGGRFVKDNDLRFLADRAGKENPLPFAVADRVEGTLRQMFRMHCGQSFIYLFFIMRRKDAQPPGIGISSHRCHIAAGHQFGLDPSRKHYSHAPGQLSGGKLQEIFHLQQDFPVNRFQLTGDAFEDRRFSRAVWADQRHDFAALHANLDSVDQGAAVIADRQLVQM